MYPTAFDAMLVARSFFIHILPSTPPRLERTAVFCIPPSKKKNEAAATLLGKASFVSGRDASSVDALSSMLRTGKHPATTPGGVALVRDPVLSDQTLTDTEGRCWKQSEGVSSDILGCA